DPEGCAAGSVVSCRSDLEGQWTMVDGRGRLPRPSTIDPRPSAIGYRFRFTSSLSISSEVVITLALAWKPRWVTIIEVNSCERSTLEFSRAPAVMVDEFELPAKPSTARPELADSAYMLSPRRSKPVGLLNRASASCASAWLTPLENTPVITPDLSISIERSWPD